MSISERKLKYNLSLAKYYYANRNTDITYKDKSIEIIKKCYEPFISNLYHTLQTTSSDNIVELAEVAFTVSLPEIAENLIKIYFEQDSSNSLSKNSYYVRALLVKALVDSKIVQDKQLKAEEAANALVIAVKSIQQGLDIIAKPENKQKYASTLFNASIITINILKNYLKTNWAKNFWEVLEKLSNMLEENDDVDFNWRIFILIKLAQAYIDADKKPEGQKALDKISDILKKKGDCDFMDELYRIRIHYSRDNSGALANLKKEGESMTNYPQFKYLYTVQAIKSNIITDKDIDKEVSGVIQAVCPEFYKNISSETGKYKNDVSIKIESWKADVLAELAFAIMKFKTMITTSYNLYYFLFQNGSNSLKGKIYLENIHSQKVMYDLEENLKENVEPSEIVKQKRIKAATEALTILDKNMSGCARLQDYNLINETSMLIFNIATPFFKNPYRKIFYKAFYTACDQLEQISSNENYLRAAMHLELAKYYIEEDLLQEANTNLLKALSNDYSIPLNKIGSTGSSAGKAQDKKGGNAPVPGKDEGSNNTVNSLTNNVSYLQRNLEQYLIYLKRYIGVKVNIYEDPENPIDKLIFECDNVKNAKNETIQKETINKCLKLIEEFDFEKFQIPTTDRDFVDEEINEMKMKHDLKLYDDKKHFILICSELSKYCYKYLNYDSVFKIDKAITKYLEELNNEKDVDQLIAIAETKIECAKCYSEYLLEEGIELCANNYNNFNDANKQYQDKEKEKFDEWRNNLYNNLQEACRIAVLANQHWLIFNVGITLWNFIKPMLDAPNYASMINDNILNVLNDIFEALNNSMSYYESIGSEYTDTDYFAKVDSFVSIASLYGKILEFKTRTDDCIRICDIMLSRKLDSKYRKIFDTLRAKASKVPSDPNAKKKAPAKAPAPGKKEVAGGSFVPTQDMNLISDCFSNLENAINADDEKTKSELLKKGIEMLKGYKINFHDESTLELNSELWYKHGVQFFSLKNNQSYKYGMLCADNCVKTYDNIDIAANENKKKNISLQLQKWYCLGFLLYGDCLLNLVNMEKQERLVQIQLYFSAVEKILISAKIAEKAKQYLVLLNDTKAFYSIVINLIDMPQNREKLCPKFLNLHQILINNKQGASVLYSDPEFLLLFYSLFCLCINETKNWELGEKIICDAIKIIPNEFQHILLEHKLFYFSKQGKNFMQNISTTPSQGSGGTGGDKDILTKAKLFTKLAKSSTNKIDQFNAYNRAIELLKNDQNVYVCNVIFELSSWLYKNNYPYKDVEENLNTAADIILEIEAIFDEEDEIDEEGNELQSKRSTSSRKSRLSKKSKSKKSVSNKSKSKKKASVTGFGAKSKASERSKSRNYSSHTSKTKTIFAKMLDYDPYPLYMNLNHLEHLFKIQVFLSIVSNDYFKKQEYLLDGFFVLRKMMELSMKTMNCIEFYERNKDEINSQGLTGNNEVNPLMSLVNNYYITKDLNIPQYYNIPENLDSWLVYEWPENFINRIKMENEINSSPQNVLNNANVSLPNHTFFCAKSFETPYQFFYYFNYMVNKFMNEYYFHSECLFLIKFGILYSKYILNDPIMEYAFNLKYSRLVNNIVYNDPSNPSSQNVFKNLNSMLVDMPKLTSDIIQKKRDELRKYDLQLNSKNENYFLPTGPENVDAIIRYVDDLLPHISWIELAKEYYNVGYYNFCKDFSEEAKFHSLVLKDKDNFIKTNILLANVAFIESNFDLCCQIFNNVQNINQSPEMMFKIIRDMTYIFDYMGKYEEMNTYLGFAIEYFENDLDKVEKDTYSSSKNIFYQMYTFSLINLVRGLIKKYSENIKLNEYNIVKEHKTDMNTLLIFYNEKILPVLNKFKKISSVQSLNLYNIHSLLDFVLLSLECFTKNNLFVYVNLQELNVLTDMFENSLHTLEDISGYLNKLQSYIPLRMDNSLIYLPIHRLIAYAKILYAIINNIIGEFKNRIKRENSISEELSLDDPDSLKKKFKEGVRYNQEVIDYLNSLTRKIKEMDTLDNRDNIENLNRYEKSISLLISCESLIPKYSNEFILYNIEKINSYRLQSTHLRELKNVWDEETIEAVNELQKEKENPEELPPEGENELNNLNNEELKKKKPYEEKLEIKKFHQMTINQISEFEKNILDNDKYKRIIRYHYKNMLKYYINVIETSGYLNIELTFKSLADYQNNNIKHYFNEVIKRYVNPQSRDWATFTLHNKTKNNFSFDCPFSYIYNSVSSPESLENYEKYLEDIPYYKNANESYYTQMKELKDILPNNSSYLIFQMNEDKSILYIGFMMILGSERKFSYYIKRIILNTKINKKFDDIIQTLKVLKYSLVKTVIITKEEMERLFKDQNDKLNKALYDFENNFPEMKPILNDLDELINPKISENLETNGSKDGKDQPQPDKGADKKAAKKPADAPSKKKDKNQASPTDLPLPTSNLEQITFLIDIRLADFPFECLSIFSKIPFKSNDFSMNTLVMRLKKENFNPNTTTSISIPGNVKYYLDYSNNQEFKINLKESITNHLGSVSGGSGGGKNNNNPTGPALEGIVSNEHKPSIAELQKLYMNSTTFIFTSQTALLYQFPFEIFDTSKYSTCKVGIILDRISNLKNYVDQNSLTPKTFSFNNQPLDTIAMMTLAGIESVLTTRWSVDYDQANELLDDSLDESISKNINLSYSINKFKLPKRVLINKEEDENDNNRVASSKSKASFKGKKPPSSRGKKEPVKKKEEDVILDETNSIEVKKLPIYSCAPTVFGLGNVKII